MYLQTFTFTKKHITVVGLSLLSLLLAAYGPMASVSLAQSASDTAAFKAMQTDVINSLNSQIASAQKTLDSMTDIGKTDSGIVQQINTALSNTKIIMSQVINGLSSLNQSAAVTQLKAIQTQINTQAYGKNSQTVDDISTVLTNMKTRLTNAKNIVKGLSGSGGQLGAYKLQQSTALSNLIDRFSSMQKEVANLDGIGLWDSGIKGKVLTVSVASQSSLQSMILALNVLKNSASGLSDSSASALTQLQSLAKTANADADVGKIMNIQASSSQAISTMSNVLSSLQSSLSDAQSLVNSVTAGSSSSSTSSSSSSSTSSSSSSAASSAASSAQSIMSTISTVISTISSVLMSAMTLLISMLPQIISVVSSLSGVSGITSGNTDSLSSLTNIVSGLGSSGGSSLGGLGDISSLVTALSSILSETSTASSSAGNAQGMLGQVSSLFTSLSSAL